MFSLCFSLYLSEMIRSDPLSVTVLPDPPVAISGSRRHVSFCAHIEHSLRVAWDAARFGGCKRGRVMPHFSAPSSSRRLVRAECARYGLIR